MHNTRQGKIGIIAGQGSLPLSVALALQQSKMPYHVVGIEGAVIPNAYLDHPFTLCKLTQVGKILKIFKQEDIKEVLLLGKINRPNFHNILPDVAGFNLILKILATGSFSDDKLFRTIVEFIENKGFKVIGLDKIAPELIMPFGTLTEKKSTEADAKSILRAIEVAKALGKLDVGQAVVVQDNVIIGVEGQEGTDRLIERCAMLKNGPSPMILVKICKPNQEQRVDLPVIGPLTVRHLFKAGFGGIAISAGKSIILEPQETITLANEFGLFIEGIREDDNK